MLNHQNHLKNILEIHLKKSHNVKPLNVKPSNASNNFSNNVVIRDSDFGEIENITDGTMIPISDLTKNAIREKIKKFNNLCTKIRNLPNSTTINTMITFNDDKYNINELNEYLIELNDGLLWHIKEGYIINNDIIYDIMNKYKIASESLARILNTNRT